MSEEDKEETAIVKIDGDEFEIESMTTDDYNNYSISPNRITHSGDITIKNNAMRDFFGTSPEKLVKDVKDELKNVNTDDELDAIEDKLDTLLDEITEDEDPPVNFTKDQFTVDSSIDEYPPGGININPDTGNFRVVDPDKDELDIDTVEEDDD